MSSNACLFQFDYFYYYFHFVVTVITIVNCYFSFEFLVC